MRCSLTEKMIERFYSVRDDLELKSHLLLCEECRKTIEMISALDNVQFKYEPSQRIDRMIINYASRRIERTLFTIKRLVLSFSLASAALLFVFFPYKEKTSFYEIEDRILMVDYELRGSYDDIFSVSDYIWDLNSNQLY